MRSAQRCQPAVSKCSAPARPGRLCWVPAGLSISRFVSTTAVFHITPRYMHG
jgi:hypothetical protein